MTKEELPTTYVILHLATGMHVYALEEEYTCLYDCMIDRVPYEFIDVEGKRNTVSGRCIELMWISSPESRALGRAHDDIIQGERPKKREWEED